MRALGARLRVAAWTLLLAAGCGARDSQRAPVTRPALVAAADKPAVLATIPDDDRPPAWVSPSRIAAHVTTPSTEREIVFAERGGGVAYVVEKDDKFQVVHNGRAGRPYAAVGEVVLSPDGRRCAHAALAGGKWRMVVDGKEGEPFSAVRMPVFSPDGAHVAYQAMAGDFWYLVVDAKANGGTRTRYTRHVFSGDSSRIAYVGDVDDADVGTLAVSDLSLEKQVVVASGVSQIVANADRSRVAAIGAADGRKKVIVFAFARPELAKSGPPHDSVSGLSFGEDGVSLAYAAEDPGKRLVVLDDRAEPLPAGEGVAVAPVVRPGKRGLGVLVASADSIHLRELPPEGGRRDVRHDEAEALVYTGDGRSHAYAARRGDRWFVVVNGNEGPSFDRVVTPVFSPDGRLVIYRARKDGKRFVVVAGTDGRTIRQHPAYEQVFPVLFTADGKSTAYAVKDGRQLAWKVEPL